MSRAQSVHPIREVPDEAIADLRRRIAAARLPSQELVADRSQGVQLATIQELTRYFAAWEEPELFATEIRAAFKPLR